MICERCNKKPIFDLKEGVCEICLSEKLNEEKNMGFMDDIQADADQYGASNRNSDKFEFEKEGLYRVRVLAKPTVLATHFFGKGSPSAICYGKDKGCPFHGAQAPKDDKGNDKAPSLKLVTYVIDREDNDVKLAELPLSLSYGINDLQKDEDFMFEDWPMPYDIKIMYDPDNKDPKAKYRMQPSPNRIELSDEEKENFAAKMAKMTPEAYVEKRKSKQIEKSAPMESVQEKVDKDFEAMGEKTGVAYPKENIDTDSIPF